MIFASRFKNIIFNKKKKNSLSTFALSLCIRLLFSNRHSIWHGSVVHTTALDSEY